MTVTIGRRELLAALGGAVAWPLAARAQQPEGMRRLAIIMLTADDADGQACITALREGLEKLGWTAHNRTWQCAPRTNFCSPYKLTDQDESPLGSTHLRMRANDWDLVRAEH